VNGSERFAVIIALPQKSPSAKATIDNCRAGRAAKGASP
jgi:hypothetical protein